MPQAFAVHSVVDVVAAVVGVGVCFWIAYAYVRRRLERDRRTITMPRIVTVSTRSGHTPGDLGPRRPFRMPARVVAVAPAPSTARVAHPDWTSPFGPFPTARVLPGGLAPAHLYDLVGRDYLAPTTSMPAVRPPAPPDPPVFVAPLPRRGPRGRANWVRADWDRSGPDLAEPNKAERYRTASGWFGEGEACG
jgi:hypothetical protein